MRGPSIDRRELDKFIEWLPDISPHHAYMLQLMTRSKGMKDELGFKGSDHVLEHSLVPGYKHDWRLLLRLKVRRFALLQANADQLYVYFHHSRDGRDGRVDAVYTIPPEIVVIYIQLNPAKWIHAAVDAVQDVITQLREVAIAAQSQHLGDKVAKIVHRPDLRFYAACARRAETRFHTIDVDDRSLLRDVIDAVHELLGYHPPIIYTRRGAHVLVPIYKLSREQLKQYFGKKGLLHRLQQLGEQHRDTRTGAPLVEVKKQPLEPVPGTRYKDVTVRFTPEEK